MHSKEEYRENLVNNAINGVFTLNSEAETLKMLEDGIRNNGFNQGDIDYLLEVDYCECETPEESLITKALNEIRARF